MSNSKIRLKVLSLYKEYKDTIMPRKENISLWAETSQNVDYLPVHYTNSYMDYQYEYHKKNFKNYVDISIIYKNKNDSLSIWPLALSQDNKNNFKIDSFGVPILTPLFALNCSKKQEKLIISFYYEILEKISNLFNIKKIIYLDFYNSKKGFCNWFRIISNNSSSVNIDYALYLEIDKDINIIKKSFRKSYKSLIKLDNKFRITMLENNEKKWNEFRKLHYKVAKSITRNKKTWDIQFSHIISKDAFLIYIENEKGNIIGGGYFNCSKDECFYSVGVYDKDYLDYNLGHIINYYSIKEMISRNIKWFKLGHTKVKYKKSEKKLENVSKFKLGFTSNIFPEFQITNTIKKVKK